MTKYNVKYLFGENKIEDKYFDFTKAIRVAEINNIYYPVKYDTTIPNHGPFGNPYIEIEEVHYPVKCQGEVIEKDIELNGEIIHYQAVNQICWIEI
jgi:hypothetical protein